MSALTRDQIVDTALKQAGNTSITDLANTWLNNILDRLYEDYHWPFQEKTTTGTLAQGATTVSLPSDYADVWNEYGLKIEDSDGKFQPLLIRDADYLDTLVDPSVQGPPEIAIVDLKARTWRPYPLPGKAYTWHLRYKFKPARLTGNTAPEFPNDQLLIDAVYTLALKYEDDDRAPQELSFLDLLVKKYRKGFNRSPLKGDKLEMSPEVFKPIGSLR